MADKSELDIIKELYNSFGNNPNNVETFNTLANVNPLLAAYRGAKTLANVAPSAIAKALRNEAYGIDNTADNRAAWNQIANTASGVMDVVPTLGMAKVAAKPTAKALGKALAMTENMPVGLSIKDVSGKTLSPIEEKILNQGGNYALQRFQKAKSLAPDLEKQYTEDALIPLFTSKTERNVLTVMKPSEFQNFASPLSEEYTSSPQFASKIENLQNIANTTGFNEVPHLHLNKYDHEPVITSHEGRHRTTAFTENNDNPTLVEISPRYSMYERVNPSFNMNQKQFINAINKEMSLNPNVRPQPEFVNDVEKARQPIKFPNELFGVSALPFIDYTKKK